MTPTTFLEESEIYAKWKDEHGDVIYENNPTGAEWYVRNYVDTRLIPAIESRLTLQRKEMREMVSKLLEYAEHKPRCIRSQFEAGRPKEGGGYEQKFGGHWYRAEPTDETPKCDCGLSDVLNALDKEI